MDICVGSPYWTGNLHTFAYVYIKLCNITLYRHIVSYPPRCPLYVHSVATVYTWALPYASTRVVYVMRLCYKTY
jgi:hypothetical protein